MSTLALLVLLMLMGAGGAAAASTTAPSRGTPKRKPPPTPTAALPPPSAPPAEQAHAKQQQAAAAKAPPPWPQAMPAGLPAFPGPGWVADNPPPTSVVTRAWQLLPELWKSGQPGGRKTEQTQGRWITYLATAQGAKRAVVAYRLKDPIAAATPPASAPKPQQPLILTATPTNGLATLRQGSTGPAVSKAQALLGIAADGKFGPGTKAAVVAFQTGHGLTPDGVIGPATWQALTIRAA